MTKALRGPRARVGLVLAAALALAATSLGIQRVAAAPVTINETCNMDPATATKFGASQVADPMFTQLTTTPFALSIPGDVSVTPSTVAPGGVIHLNGQMTIDMQTVANDLLTNQVKPAIAAQNPGLAPTAFLNMTLTNLKANFPIPAEISSVSNITANSTGPAASAAQVGSDLQVSVGTIQAGAYSLNPATPQKSTTSTSFPPMAPFTVTLDVDGTVDPGTADGTVIQQHPGPITFDLKFEVGVYFFGGLVAGGVQGTQACTPNDPAQVLASTTVVAPTTTTTAPTTTTTAPTTTTTAPTTTTTAPTTTTTAPTTTTTAPTTTTTAPTTTTTAPTTTTTAPTTTTTAPTTTTTAPTTTTTAPTTTTTAPTTTTTAPTTTTTAPTTTTTAPTTTTTAPTTTTTAPTTTTTAPSTTTTTAPCTPKVTVSPTSLMPGQKFNVSSECWAPGSTVVVTLESTPVNLGNLVVDSLGKVAGTFSVPADFPAGAHNVVLTGTSLASSAQVLSAGVTIGSITSVPSTAAPTVAVVTATGTLPRTGNESTLLLQVGGALLVAGGLLLGVSRRRASQLHR